MLASSKFRKDNSDDDLLGLTAPLHGTYGPPKASRKPHSLGARPAWTGASVAYQARGARVARMVGGSGAVNAVLKSRTLDHASHPAKDGLHDIAYGCGRSSLGDFLVAMDDNAVCAVLFGDDQASLLDDLRAAFPSGKLTPGGCSFAVDAIAHLIERPCARIGLTVSMRGGEFEQMVGAALRHTRPGTTITPDCVAAMIGAASASVPYVRACAAADILAVAVPFHRLEERDGTSPAYRWGEERRRALLAREAAI